MVERHATYPVGIRWAVRIPLRDCVKLSGVLFEPSCSFPPGPTIVLITPYMADTYHERGMYFAKHGLRFLVVDSRGRGNSDGTFFPMLQEAEDGYDIVEWVASQSFSNGKVAMWGGSYGGYAQWATAKEFPPHLATIVPVASPYFGVDFPFRGNIFYPYLIQWMTLTGWRSYQKQCFEDNAFWAEKFHDWDESGTPFCRLDERVCGRLPAFQEWISHPEPDAYWDRFNPTAAEHRRINIPILTITGSFDDDQPGALQYYKEHMKHGSGEGRGRHYLVIGPWNHAGTRTPAREVGGLKVGEASVIDLSGLHRAWYEWVMSGGPKPEFLARAVAYYVVGAERWRYADALEDATARYQVLYLDSRGAANDVFAAGMLATEPGGGPPDSYTYDPAARSRPELRAQQNVDPFSLVDQRIVLALSGRLFVYQTAPFDEDLEITGFFRLTLWIAIDTPDTDFYAAVYDIGEDGTVTRLSTDAMRARYRKGWRKPELVGTRSPLRYDLTGFTFISIVVRRGHRLRLVISPVGQLVESSFVQKNYNSGAVVAQESIQDARTTTVTLFHDATHSSALHVPIGRPAEDCHFN